MTVLQEIIFAKPTKEGLEPPKTHIEKLPNPTANLQDSEKTTWRILNHTAWLLFLSAGKPPFPFLAANLEKKVSMLTPKLILLKGHHPEKNQEWIC